jgi:hypothetical protein
MRIRTNNDIEIDAGDIAAALPVVVVIVAALYLLLKRF